MNSFKITPIRSNSLFSSGNIKNATLTYTVNNLPSYTHLYFLFNGAFFVGEMIIPGGSYSYSKTFSTENYKIEITISGTKITLKGSTTVYGDMYVMGFGIR